MKKTTVTKPTQPTQPTKTTPPRARRPLSSLLYGPSAVRLRAQLQPLASAPNPEPVEKAATQHADPAEYSEAPENQLAVEEPAQELGSEQRTDSVAEEGGIGNEPARLEPAQPDQRANRIITSLLSKEKKDLPEWMAELLAPMDEADQLAFLLKHRAEMNASRRGRVGVPASPSAEPTPQETERAAANHRRVYDTF